MNKTIPATRAVVPISTNECPESKPGRADPSAPACASVQLSPPIAQMTRRFPRVTTEKRDANHGTRYPGVGVSSCFARDPKDHGKEDATGNMTSADCLWSDARFPLARMLFANTI
jgi:hypothetical protein